MDLKLGLPFAGLSKVSFLLALWMFSQRIHSGFKYDDFEISVPSLDFSPEVHTLLSNIFS